MSRADTDRLTLRGVTKAFGPTVVLDRVDLTVERGQTVLLTGENGSGKTTLLRCVAGLVPYTGEILFRGTRCCRSARSRRSVGYLPQGPGLPPWATGREILELFARLRDTTPHPSSLPSEFLPPLDRPLATLSGGQRQRIAIATTLLGEPSLLLLDEPAANLDETGREDLKDLVVIRRDQGTSILIAAPSPGDLGMVPDRIVHVAEGRITPEGPDEDAHPDGAATVTQLRPREVAG